MPMQESYLGLARKWRPQSFEDLVGQEAVRESFQQSLRANRVAHGHLLAGPRGVGKTTSARILAMALNCEKDNQPTARPCGKCRHCLDIAAGIDLDIIEIDAASNTKVDQMRELLERVVQSPFAARFKVYIIDEVHMLSPQSFNALLKTLEEPPPQVVFVLATTELEKVPETVRSRCVLHAFRRLSAEDIVVRLDQVARGEGLALDPAAAREMFGHIARSVEGGMRDALVLLDQLLALTDGKPDVESAIKLLGLADRAVLAAAVGALAAGDATRLIALVEELTARGRSLERFVKGLIAYLRDLMLLQAGADAALVALTGDALTAAQTQARELDPATLFNILNHLFELEEKLKSSTQARFLIEFTFLRLAAVKPVVPIDEIMRRIRAVPEGAFGPAPGPTPDAGSDPRTGPARMAMAPAMAPAAMSPVMNDGAVAAPPRANASAASLPIGSDRADLLEWLVPQLPDASRFLERYLRQAARLRLDESGLEIAWSDAHDFGKRMFERTENTQAVEATLTRLAGRPMRIRSSITAGAPEAAPPRRAEVRRPPEPLDAPTLREPAAADQDALDLDSTPYDEEVDEPPPFASPPPRNPTPKQPAAASADSAQEQPIDRRSAREKAQALLAQGGEVARRAKLLREMFHGRPIDEQGQPISI